MLVRNFHGGITVPSIGKKKKKQHLKMSLSSDLHENLTVC